MTDSDGELELARKRLKYRANYRGTKEMDWLLGRFADAELPSMTATDLEHFECLLALPDPELEDMIIYGQPGGDAAQGALLERVRRFHGIGDEAPKP